MVHNPYAELGRPSLGTDSTMGNAQPPAAEVSDAASRLDSNPETQPTSANAQQTANAGPQDNIAPGQEMNPEPGHSGLHDETKSTADLDRMTVEDPTRAHAGADVAAHINDPNGPAPQPLPEQGGHHSPTMEQMAEAHPHEPPPVAPVQNHTPNVGRGLIGALMMRRIAETEAGRKLDPNGTGEGAEDARQKQAAEMRAQQERAKKQQWAGVYDPTHPPRPGGNIG